MISQTASTSEEYPPTKLRNAPLQAMNTAGTHFLLRTCVDRLAGGGTHTIAAEMEKVRCRGLHLVEVLDRKGNPSEAILELKRRSASSTGGSSG
jgi:hypothetical protein